METSIPSPGNVALPSNLLHAIGHVTAIWAQLEFRIDSTIYYALERPDAPRIKTTLARPFDQRLDLLLELLPLILPKQAIDEWALALIGEIRALHPRRNLVVHGAVANSQQELKGKAVYWFRRVRWERPVRIAEKRALSVAQVERLATDISNQIAMAALMELYARP